MRKVRDLVLEYSVLLLCGTVAGLIWANIDHYSYETFVHFWFSDHAIDQGAGHHWNMHFLVNGIGMCFFFAIAAKEAWESLLPGGQLSDPKKAALPLLATVGGMAGPALLFVGGAAMLGVHHLMRGWAVPCATDIAFSYLVARIVFGQGHPAIPFLLLLAIVDDAAGLIILAVFYPSASVNFVAFGILLAVACAVALLFRTWKVAGWHAYIFGAGSISWLAFYFGGLEPALGLVPIIPFIPHAKTDIGVFAREELDRHDPLNEMEHRLKIPVEVILCMFGMLNAGVVLGSAGPATGLVAFGLLVGKPLGITLFALAGIIILRLRLPEGMRYRDLVTVGVAAGIGFTVALFVSTVAFRPGTEGIAVEDLDASKMGALISFAAFIMTIVVAKVLRVQKMRPEQTVTDSINAL